VTERPEVGEDQAGLMDLARLLLAHEAGGDPDPLRTADALERVWRKLNHQIAPVVGELGVRLMMVRAVKITQAQFSFLVADPVSGDDEPLKGLRKSLKDQAPAMATEALASLLANFLEVLTGLLGRRLTHGFLRAAWLDLDLE
jgi:hypothetical protein